MCIGNSDNFLAVAYHPSAHTRTCFLSLEAEGPSSKSIPEAELTWSSRSDMSSYQAGEYLSKHKMNMFSTIYRSKTSVFLYCVTFTIHDESLPAHNPLFFRRQGVD